MTRACTHCGGDLAPGSPRQGFEGDDDLCPACNRAELAELLRDCDPDELKTLRRRIEDLLRKSPADLLHVAADLAAAGRIRIDDLI